MELSGGNPGLRGGVWRKGAWALGSPAHEQAAEPDGTLLEEAKKKRKPFSEHIIVAFITKQWNCPDVSGTVFNAYQKSGGSPQVSYLVTSERMRRGHRKTLAMFILLSQVTWEMGDISMKKKSVTNEVPQALEISWSRYLILFSEKPFNFLLLKRSNLLFVAKLPKLIEGWFISPHFISFELHTEILSNATCCLHRNGSTEAGLSPAYMS